MIISENAYVVRWQFGMVEAYIFFARFVCRFKGDAPQWFPLRPQCGRLLIPRREINVSCSKRNKN